MRRCGLRGVRRDKTRKTTLDQGAETQRPEDLVKRQFAAVAPNQLWVADLTYIRTHAGWTYAAFVIDVFTPPRGGLAGVDQPAHRPRAGRSGHGVMGPSAGRSGRHRAHPPLRPVELAQYRAVRYTERLAEAEAAASVGSKGDSYDNAMAEALNSLFKAECIRNPVMRPNGGWNIGRRRRDRRRRVRRLVQPTPPPRQTRPRPTGQVRGRLLGQQRQPALPRQPRPHRGRNQITVPSTNPGRFKMERALPKGKGYGGQVREFGSPSTGWAVRWSMKDGRLLLPF